MTEDLTTQPRNPGIRQIDEPREAESKFVLHKVFFSPHRTKANCKKMMYLWFL